MTFGSTLGTMEFPGGQGGEQNLGTRFSMSKSWAHKAVAAETESVGRD